jgi:hypothetical protein
MPSQGPNSISRALPSGGPSNAPSVPSLSLQSIDRPNPNAKFSRATPSRTNVSSVFKEGTPDAVRTGKKCAPVSARQPSVETTPRSTLKISRFDEQQSAAARKKEDTFRPLRRMADPTASASGSRAHSPVSPIVAPFNPTASASLSADQRSPRRASLVSANGTVYSGGRKEPGRKNVETGDAPTPSKDYMSMERFKTSERLQTREANVLKPETLPTHIPPFKAQRFGSSPDARHETLTGVFRPDPERKAPPSYRPRAPFHTD